MPAANNLAIARNRPSRLTSSRRLMRHRPTHALYDAWSWSVAAQAMARTVQWRWTARRPLVAQRSTTREQLRATLIAITDCCVVPCLLVVSDAPRMAQEAMPLQGEGCRWMELDGSVREGGAWCGVRVEGRAEGG
jgi:hypothetical protein